MSDLFEKIKELFQQEDRKFSELSDFVGNIRRDLDQLSGRMLLLGNEEGCPTCLGRGRVKKKEVKQIELPPLKEEPCTHPTVYDGVCQKCGFDYKSNTGGKT